MWLSLIIAQEGGATGVNDVSVHERVMAQSFHNSMDDNEKYSYKSDS
jgi:hypothetical protein